MSNIKLTDGLCHDIPDVLLLTHCLLQVERHQDVEVRLQALRLVHNNLSESAQEHILVLWRALLNQVNDLLQEKVSIARRDHTQRHSCRLPDLIILALKLRGEQTNNVLELG